MRIGLLISEFRDTDVCDLCIGADKAAKDLGIELVIFPGKYIVTDKSHDVEDLYLYQYQAVYDYCIDTGFDGFIVDIEKIGKDAPILKKEAFLNQFGKKPLITVTRMDGFKCIDAPKGVSSYEIGYLGMEQMLFKISKNNISANREDLSEYTVDQYKKTIDKAADVSDIILDFSCDANYDVYLNQLRKAGITDLEVFLLEEPVECSLKRGWKVPKHCVRQFSIHKNMNDNNVINNENILTTDIFQNTNIKGTKVFRNFFFKSEQIGFYISDFNDDFRSGSYDDILTNSIASANRIGFLKKCLNDCEEELQSCQEEIARDGSVLDHIGDKDYLTDLPNRRGFFAEAYDLLKEDFKEGTYAVVAYIDMDSLKNINAIHGHDEGDKAVCRVAEILEEVFTEKSVFGRIRGDEFAVIQITDEEDKAESLRVEMARQNNKLYMENMKYLNHLIYSICEFDYDESLSLREMLKETDNNLKKMRRMEITGKHL